MAFIAPQATTTTPPQEQPGKPTGLVDTERLETLQEAARLLGQMSGWELAARALSSTPHTAARLAGAGLGAALGGTALETLVTEDPVEAAKANTESALAGATFASMIERAAPLVKRAAEKPIEKLKESELFRLAAQSIKGATEKLEGASARLARAVGSVLSSTRATGGATYNLAKGNLANTDNYVVSTHPDRTRILTHEPTPQDIQDYIYRNSDLLSREDKSLGVWHNTGNKTWELDVTSTTPSLNEAVSIAQRNHELAAFSLKSMRPVNTWYDLEHYGPIKNLSTLDPVFYGTASAGAEAKRVLHEDAPKRTFYYIKGTAPEDRLAKDAKYVTQVPASRIYDTARDRDGILAKYPNPTDWENEIKKRGYLGFLRSDLPDKTDRGQVVLFHPLPVLPAKDAASLRLGETMTALTPIETEKAAKPLLSDLANQILRVNPAPYTTWKEEMRDWIPEHLQRQMSATTWRALYNEANTAQLTSLQASIPQGLSRLLELHGQNSPYVDYERHILPVLREWVGERAPVMVAALGATMTETGADLQRAVKVYHTVLTASTTEQLRRRLLDMKIHPSDTLLAVHEQVHTSGLNSAAVSRQLDRLMRVVSTDPTLKPLSTNAINEIATSIRQRTPINQQQTVDVLEAAADLMQKIERDPADKPLWSALGKITDRNWNKWRERYNIPDLGTPDFKRKLALMTVLGAAAAAGIAAAPPDSRATIYRALQDDGLYLPPRSINRLTSAALAIRSAETD